MRIEVLGCSGGIGPGLRTTSLLLDDDTLIDAGTGVGDLTLKRMQRIRRVFLTHSHLDHVCALPFMADNLLGLISQPVEVLATTATLKAVRAHIFNWETWPDFAEIPDAGNPVLVFREIAIGEALELAPDCRVRSFEVRHTVPAVGYIVEGSAQIFVFSGDTFHWPPLWETLNRLPRLDHLMIEIALPNEEDELATVARHLTPRRLGEALRHLRHRPQLLLTHYKPGFEALIKKQCKLALSGWDYLHLRRGHIVTI